jgi:hypothetical protein
MCWSRSVLEVSDFIALIPGGHRQVIWRLNCVKRRCKHDHDGEIGAVGTLADGRDSDRHDGEYGIWREQILPAAA